MKNRNLNTAKLVKNDEFYTQLPDIEKELNHYKNHFRGKTIFLNCDDPQKSNFWMYFQLQFKELGLKKLIATHFDPVNPTYKLEITGDINGDGKVDHLDIVKTALKQNGDFRSDECIELLKECDIVVTNPPFSLFREYIAQLMEFDKKFIVVGSMNAITYKEIFPLIKEDKLWLGNLNVKEFMQPNGSTKKFGNIHWYTNLDFPKRHEDIILFQTYNPTDYPTYDNYNAINVDKVKDIPIDYTGAMGVPITFLAKYNPNQFEIIGIDRLLTKKSTGKTSRMFIKGKEIYARIIIKRK